MSSLRASAVYCAVLDLQFAGGARRLAGQRALGDAAGDVSDQAVGVDGHLVAERHGDFAGDEERILLDLFRGPHQSFIGRRQHGVGEIGGLNARQRNLDLALHEDLAAGDAEIEIGRSVDARLGHVDHAQVFAIDADFAVGQAVAPLDLARARERAGAGLGGGAELEVVGHDARFHLERAQREIELVEVELRAG